jgi:hypothetical protein
MKVQILEADNYVSLREEINIFIHNKEIIDIKFAISKYDNYYAMILYKEND